jgi:hypothetical protein
VVIEVSPKLQKKARESDGIMAIHHPQRSQQLREHFQGLNHGHQMDLIACSLVTPLIRPPIANTRGKCLDKSAVFGDGLRIPMWRRRTKPLFSVIALENIESDDALSRRAVAAVQKECTLPLAQRTVAMRYKLRAQRFLVV